MVWDLTPPCMHAFFITHNFTLQGVQYGAFHESFAGVNRVATV